MNSIEETILSDIKKCEEMINNKYATREDLEGFIAKYRNFNPKFGSNIVYYVEVPGHKPNYASKISIIKNELEGLLLGIKTKNNNSNSSNSVIVNVYNEQTQNNNNSNNNYFELDRLVEQIKNSIDSIDDKELQSEIIDYLEGLQEEIKKEKPKKGIITSISNSLKTAVTKIPKAVEVGTSILELIKCVKDIFNL